MNSENVCYLERWVVRDNQGEVISRFATQAKALDFATRTGKQQNAIVVVDINRLELQLIGKPAERQEEKAS